MKDGKLVGAIAQERIDRIKHSASIHLPFAAIDALLTYLGIGIEEVDNFGFSSTAVYIDDLRQYVSDAIIDRYHLTNVSLTPVPHHQSHAESTYFTSDFSEAIVFVADGGGEVIQMQEESESIFYGKGNELRLLEQRLQSSHFHALSRPHNYLYPFMHKGVLEEQISLGKKYAQITNLLGFGTNGAGKTMGLSAYGYNMVSSAPTKVGSPFNFNLDFQHIIKDYYTLYEQSNENYFVFMEKQRENIARTVQDYTENQVLEIIQYMLTKYQIPQICLAGGLFLNCPLNHKIIEQFPEVTLHICPAAGDDGQAIGAAFAAHRMASPKLDRTSSVLPYLGISYTDDQIELAIKARNLPYHYYPEDQMATLIAERIYDNQIVAFLHGRSEIGPRALCHRSILANPMEKDMKDHINAKVKHRENFRPFAPVVAAERQFTYFTLRQESPYMLFAADVKEEYADKFPAITHVDGTARIQAIKREDDQFVHQILMEFERLSGFPVLLNTSFNDNGEPVVESPSDAILTFLKTEIDVLIMEHYILFKDELSHQTPKGI